MPIRLYDTIIKPIRDADRTKLLEDYLEGKQSQFELIRSKSESLFKLNDVFTQDNRQALLALLWQLGFEGELQEIFEEWTNLQLRKLLSVVAELWKKRGTQGGIEAVIRIFLPGSPFLIRNWFWYRPIIGEAWLEGHNSSGAWWGIEGPGLGLDEFETNIYLKADYEEGQKLLLVPLDQVRANSERINLYYVDFLATFDNPFLEIDWAITGDVSVDNGYMLMVGTSAAEAKNVDLADLYILMTVVLGGVSEAAIKFRIIDSDNYCYVHLDWNNGKLELIEVVSGTPTTIQSVDVLYIGAVDRSLLIEAEGNRVLVFWDGTLLIDNVVTAITGSGGFSIDVTDGGYSFSIDDIIISRLPSPSGYVGP